MIKRTISLVSLIALTVLFSCNNQQTGEESAVYVMPPEIEALPVGTTLGLRAPEIVLPNADGELMKLSSLRGHIVLVDFWAAWCNPCRRENPELVKLYDEYNEASFTKGEGFEIFSVSLDRNEAAWQQAVRDDKLNWPYQVGDMQGARTQAAQDYGVQMIPSSFLLDQHGVVLATNLRSKALEEKLNSLLKED